jgi:hypothetical protein
MAGSMVVVTTYSSGRASISGARTTGSFLAASACSGVANPLFTICSSTRARRPIDRARSIRGE